ncbi:MULTISPECIES: transcriptional regulator [unclassified Streptomyces]|uniref:transcriptional regulator n=1 Tax=unclassified Streptomyces TaxID=2593676 RepID=UPI000C2725FB|nr:helix-turn-helix transcriptional regulator [Streptomyces sp. CB02959]PJN33508.1 transcriptional regulator [Streptomyces sp. CB02959]
MEPPEQGDAAKRFAQRFNRLNESIYPATQDRPYTEQEIADQIQMSVSQVSNLRNGRSVPRGDRAMRLAALYGVRLDYFFLPDDAEYVMEVEQHLLAIDVERRGLPQKRANRTAGSDSGPASPIDDEVRHIAEGLAELPSEFRDVVGALVDTLRERMGLHPRGRRSR